MRGSAKDSMWLFLGVILLFTIMASFSPGSQIGSAFLTFRSTLENAFGGEVGYCPFINPYAMAIYSAGELVITGGHALCDPVEFALGKMASGLDGKFDAAALKDETCSGPSTYSIRIINDDAGVNDFVSDFYKLYPDKTLSIMKNDLSAIIPIIKADSGSEVIGYVEDNIGVYPLVAIHYNNPYGDGLSKGSIISSDIFFQTLVEMDEADLLEKDNKIAIQLLSEKRPAWQCFFIFGLLPFFITFYLLNDILMFAYLRTNTRRLIAVFASLLAILTGAFANIIVAVSSFVGLSVGQSFLMAIFSLAIISVFMGQLTVTAGVAATTVSSVQKAVTGALVLTNVANATDTSKEQK